MQYTESDLVRIAKRENNTKRNYLVVDPLQGKHIPVSPSESLKLFETLGRQVKQAYPDEKILFVGFAETATAIGAGVAIHCGGYYLQTTRECVPQAEYLFFSEEHSHATAQKLVRNDLDKMADEFDRIVFVEDEVTTGKTILNIIMLLEKEYPQIKSYAVASLLNGMNAEALTLYESKKIDLHYLVKTNHDSYPEIADRYMDVRGTAEEKKYYHEKEDSAWTPKSSNQGAIRVRTLKATGYQNTRRVADTKKYEKKVQELCRQLKEEICIDEERNICVLGTEEFMYPAMAVGAYLEKKGKFVRFHATTRSPIAICSELNYPLKERFSLDSLYEAERNTFIYNLAQYDHVLVLTDAHPVCEKGLNSLLKSLADCGNKKVTVICWENE